MHFKTDVCLCLMFAALFSAGCEQPAPPTTPSGSSPSPPATRTSTTSAVPPIVRPAQAAPTLGEAASEGPPTQSDVASNASPPPAPVAAPQALPTNTSPRIQLSTGIALAQTLPDGTSVLCSMEYQWVTGGPQPGVEYFWVIELGDGQRMSGAANVSKQSGKVQAILHRVKPDQGPFKGAIFARNTNAGLPLGAISEFIPLAN